MTDARAAVGVFDGVHLGHRAVLERADVALTFDIHPLSLLAPERAPEMILPLEEKLRLIRACGVADVRVIAFDRATASLAPEDFAARYLLPLGRRIACGADWRFGRGAAGDVAWLRAHGFEVEVFAPVPWAGERISSTRIRRALAEGRLEEARAMLGRPYEICGETFAGKGVGRQIGFPTVNFRPRQFPHGLHLPNGVFLVEVAGARGLANLGVAPTMGERAWREPVLEIHFADRVPEDVARVSFLRFVRPERTFDSLEALRRQIAADCDILRA